MKKSRQFLGIQSLRFCITSFTMLLVFLLAACNVGTGPDVETGTQNATVSAADITKMLSVHNIDTGNGAALVYTPEAAKSIVFPIIKLLGDRHDEVDDEILEKIEETVERAMSKGNITSHTFDYNAATFPVSRKIAAYGISGIAGTVKGSAELTGDATSRSEVFAFSGINLEYSYNSDNDDGYQKKNPAANTFVRGWVKATGSTIERESRSGGNESESEEEAMVITFVVAFNDGVNSGKVAAELGYSYKEVENETVGQRDTESFEYGPFSAKFTFYDNDENIQGEFIVTEEADRKRIFKFWDID